MHLFPCKGNLMGKTKQKSNTGLIRLDNQTLFPSKQLSQFLAWRCQPTIVVLYKMMRFPCLLFLPLLENLITWVCQKMCICIMLLCIRTNFFQSCRLHFFIKRSFKFWTVLNCEFVSFIALSGYLVGWEFQHLHMHVNVPAIPTHLSKTSDWTSSAKVSGDNFNGAYGYSINIFRNILPAFVIVKTQIGKSLTCSSFSL